MRYLLVLLSASAFAQVGTLTIRETTGSTQTSRPITFGRVFKQGDIAANPRPRVNGVTPTLWQVDVKNRWDDNSVKFAIISFHTDLSANATVAVDFESSSDACHLGNLATCQAAALDGAGMLAQRSSNWTATIEITNGTTQTANARTMINAGAFSYWLRGPVVTQMIVRDVSSARAYDMGFATTGGLSPMFIITAYPAYTAGIRQEFVLENTWTDKVIDQTYSLAIKNGAGGSNTVYSRSSFTHYPSARWHKGNEASQIWDGTAPSAIEINHNARYLIAAKAFPNHDPDVTISAGIISTMLTTFNASDKGDAFGEAATVAKGFSTTGGRPDIGWIYQWQLRALYAGDRTLDEMVFNLGDVSGHATLNIREARTDNYFCPTSCTGGNATVAATGKPISVGGRPSFWTSRSYWTSAPTVADRITAVGSYTLGGWSTDQSHAPSLAYMPYLISGSFYYYEQVMFWANWNTLSSPWHTLYYGRNYEYGIVNPLGEQMRATAWALRTISQAAFIAEDGSPDREHLRWVLAKNAEFWEGAANVTAGNYPPSDSSCPGNTPGSAGPTSGANRSAWCFGRKIFDAGRTNPNGVPVNNIGQYGCQNSGAQYFGVFDCVNLGTSYGHSWQWAYFIQAIGWANEAVQSVWGPTLAAYSKFWIDTNSYQPKMSYVMMLGSKPAATTLYIPMVKADNTRFSTVADYTASMLKAGSTTLVGSISSTDTSFQVTDYTQISWKPMWRRTAASISSISVTSGTVRITFTSAHGLAVGDRIMTTGHSNAAFNTNNTSTGGVIDRRYLTGIPSATAVEFAYVGASAPADGSYAVDGTFVAQTPAANTWFRIGSEVVQICRLEVDGTATIGQNNSSEGTLSSTQCTGSSTYRARNSTTAVAHTAGETVEQAYDLWEATTRDDTQGGVAWIMRTGMSFFYPYTGDLGTGSGFWSWIETNLYTPYGSEFQTDSNPTLSVTPRSVTKFRITTTGLPSGTVGAAYSQTLTSADGSGAVTWSVASGYSLPAGLSLNSSTGAITGSVSGTVATAVRFRATDATAAYREETFGLAFTSGVTITITPTSLSDVTVGASVSQTFSASGGTAPYTWTLTASSLPPGLTLSSSGLLSGNPTTGGTYTFTIRVTDALGNIADRPYTWIINWVTLSITTGATLTSGVINVPYSTTVAATGGDGSYTWTLVGGVFPAGLSLNASTGEISGTPNTAANYSFTLRCTSGDAQTNDKTFTLIVTPPSTDVSFKGTRTRGMAIRCCGRAGSSTADTWDTITTTWAGTTTSWSGT